MCGIAGVAFAERERPPSAALLKAMTDAIRHRGPDDEGWHLAPGVALGMVRLSVIDLAGGHQPIYNEDKSCVIVYNGEIYNHAEVRRDLEGRGHRFATRSDTEAVVHAYEEYGPRCVERLRGMFAFAIWDMRHETLFIARDRFGIKPLYYTHAPWGIAFGSELPVLAAGGFTARRLDSAAVDAFFQLGYVPADRAIYDDVRKLPPAHTLLWRRGREPEIAPYWDLPAEASDRSAPTDAEVLSWLDESVTAHLVSDVPLAVFLSGGIDSSAIASSMALMREAPHAFTVRYQGSGAAGTDEVPLAAELATRYGIRLSVVDVEPDLRDLFPRIMHALDEPIADESAVPSWLLYERVSSEYKVALAGTGGDELFVGYRRHMAMLLDDRLARIPAPLRRLASRIADRLPEPSGSGLGVNRIKRYLRTSDGAPSARYLGYLTKTTHAQRSQLFKGALNGAADAGLERRFAALAARVAPENGLRTALTLDYKVYLPDDLLALSDRLSMAHGLEVRVPFVDHVLVERAFALQERLRVKQFTPKWLLRRALRSRLPAAHFSAPKRGFVGPTASWLRHEMREMVTDELSASRLAAVGLFDSTVVQRMLQEHFDRKQNHEGVLWSLLTFLAWHRAHATTASGPLAHST